MWQLVAIVLIAVTLFYWVSFMFSIWCWLQVIFCLCQLQFVRATIWFSLGSGMLFWWMGSDIDFDTWLGGSAVIVGMGVIATLLRYHRKQQAMLSVPATPAWTPPKTPANDNQLVVFSLHARQFSPQARSYESSARKKALIAS
jgi:hypothetical protein